MSQFEKLQKAAALKYSQPPADSAPVVVASGIGSTAQKIVEIAQDSGVPVFQDDSLASLLSQLKSGTQIPPELYRAIVDIYVYFLGFTINEQGKAVRVSPAPKPAEPLLMPEFPENGKHPEKEETEPGLQAEEQAEKTEDL